MTRFITDHATPGELEHLIVIARDNPGEGGANHFYEISGFNTATHRSDPRMYLEGAAAKRLEVPFQNGPIPEFGVNGVTNEALLAIVIDRLRGFQSGPFSCRENALAITKLEEAMHWLHARTHSRSLRGVEGKREV